VNSVVSRQTSLGENTVIKNSFICDSCKIGKGVHVVDSVLGENVSVSDGKKLTGQKLNSNESV